MIRLLTTICCLHLYVGATGTQLFTIPEGCTTKGENISSPGSWACIWYNLENLTCWFDLEKIFDQQIDLGINNNILVNYRINGFYEDIKLPAKERCVKLYDPTENYGICTFNLTLEFSESRESVTKIIEFNSKQLAKLSSVRGVQYSTTTSSVAFQIPLEKNEFEREIRIRYRSELDRENESGWKELLGLWKNDYNMLFAKMLESDFSDFLCDLTLANLTAFTTYDILIDLIFCDNGSRVGYWSDAFSITIRTDDDVPIDVPKFSPGFFMHVNSTCVQIFWNPIPLVKRCGNITAYRLKVNRGLKEETQADKTILIPVPPEKISHTVLIYPYEINRIRLSQRTRHGFPKIPDAFIYLFPENRRPKIPKIFTFEKVSHSHVLLTWGKVEEDNVVSITVVWCRGTLPGYCFEPLQSKIFQMSSENVSTASITLNSKDYLSYIYGISLEVMSNEGLITSSGIQWYMDCLYNKYGIPNIAPHLKISYYSHSRVFVKWKPYTCEESVGKVKFYMLRYCQETKGNCTGKATLIKIQPDRYSYVISSLEDGNSYIVQVGTKLKHRDGPWSKQLFLKLPEKKKSGKIRLVIGTAAGGVSAFLILLLLTGCFCRRCIRTANADVAEIELRKIQKNTPQENQPEKGCPNKKDASGNDSGLGGSAESGCNFINNSVQLIIQLDSSEKGSNEHSLSQSHISLDSYNQENACFSVLNSGGYREVSLYESDEDEYDDMSEFASFIFSGDLKSDRYQNHNLNVDRKEIDESEYSHEDETTGLYGTGAPSSNYQIDGFEGGPENESVNLTDCTLNSQHERHDCDFELLIDSYSKEGYGSF